MEPYAPDVPVDPRPLVVLLESYAPEEPKPLPVPVVPVDPSPLVVLLVAAPP